MLLLVEKNWKATIVPSEDGTFAWLFFNKPMPDSSLIEGNGR